MKVLSVEWINDDRYDLWICAHFDNPIKSYDDISDEEMELAEKLVAECVYNDKELLKEFCEREKIDPQTLKFDEVEYIGRCPDYEDGAHFVFIR